MWKCTDVPIRALAVLGVLLVGIVTIAPACADSTNDVVTLSAEKISASGIEVETLPKARYTPQSEGIVTVLDPQPLVALSAQLAAARASAAAAAKSVKASEAEARRANDLYRHGGNAALREVQSADAAAATARAQQVAAASAYAAKSVDARSRWGAVLTALAERGPQALANYAEGRVALLELAMPLGSANTAPHEIQVRLPNGPSLSAQLLGPSPHAGAVLPGPTFFYRSDDGHLRTGWRLSASVPTNASVQSGVVVPASAVIWYAGQSWVYAESSPGHFRRRPVAVDARDGAGWFQAQGFRVGERVVTHGGELLLSQELLPPPGTQPASSDDD
ncbi:MAG: hypothetical protein EPN36_16930 [Rhodanobacteraceae bacterium]|nr:MAG: hypothetical protein EPN36_16930 [Rhodanobacteraceae bacterium]